MITLQFSTTGDWSSEAIRVFERGWCSHVDAVMDDGSLLGARSDEIGGKPAGVQIRPANYEKWTKVERCQIDAPGDAFLRFLHSQIGKPYDDLALVGLVMERNWRSAGSWFCSELQAAALERDFFPHMLSSAASHISPRDLLLVVSPWLT